MRWELHTLAALPPGKEQVSLAAAVVVIRSLDVQAL